MDALPDRTRVTEHRGQDDLLSAGLGLAGLRAEQSPPFADAAAPTPAELRRRAVWSNWRQIADLSPAGGFGSLYGKIAPVPGREYHALVRLGGARQPHRVLLQAPDSFDRDRRCLLVAAASGSRGVYGAIALAGAWGLPRGCAVVHTDKGAGTDYYDPDAQTGFGLDGTLAAAGHELAFWPETVEGSGVAFKHAHSQDNPEAEWGRHVRQAAEFGLHVMTQAYPDQAPFTFENTRIIAVGLSNGGGAVLRAAELGGGWLDAVVAGEPNVFVAHPGSRPLYDYATEAALLMPCALPHLGIARLPDVAMRCDALVQRGLIRGADLAARQKSAYEELRASGWSDESMTAGAITVGFDLWKAVTVAYASAYGRFAADAHPCGYRYAVLDQDRVPRTATAAERAAWWADASGIPPGAGVGLVEPAGASPMDALACLRGLWEGESPDAARVRSGIAATRAGLPVAGLPVLIVHGTDDGIIPPAFGSTLYVAAAQAAGRKVRYWQVRNAQHFDAFLGLPQYGSRYVPLLPYMYEALDRVWAHLHQGEPLPSDRIFDTKPRGDRASLSRSDMGLP